MHIKNLIEQQQQQINISDEQVFIPLNLIYIIAIDQFA